MRNPYEVLGVSATESQDGIKNAYRKLAKKHHPDLNPANRKNEDVFKEITAAYDLVGNSENRSKFDKGELDEAVAQAGARQYSSHTQGGAGARYSSDSFDFDDDLINSLFGGSARQGKRSSRGSRSGATFSMPGEDVVYKMDVDFKDAVLGAEKTLKLPGGKILQTKIPPGFKSGQKLRFAKQGSAGVGGARSGDLYVEVQVLPSAQFTRVVDNIESDLSISLAQALLGGEVTVQTLDGSILLNIPKHSNTGSKLRIRGKGVASSSGTRGDHIVKLTVMLPDPPDPKLDDLVKSWSDESLKNKQKE